MKRPKMLIGVDPGLATFSLAYYWPPTRLYERFFTGTKEEAIHDLVHFMHQNPHIEVFAVVEDPNMDSSIFHGWEQLQSQIKKYKFGLSQLSAIESVFRKVCKIAQNVGQNKLVASQFLDFLQVRRIPTVRIAPSQRTRALLGNGERLNGIALMRASMATKTDPDQFAKLTGHKRRTNEHQRDAATLVYDRTSKWVELQLAIQPQN